MSQIAKILFYLKNGCILASLLQPSLVNAFLNPHQEPLPKDVHLERIKDQTTGEMVEIEMINSQWPAGDGDKSRIENREIFQQRLGFYSLNKASMMEKLRDGAVHWETIRIRPGDWRLPEPFWSSRLEGVIFEMALLVSEGSYLDAVFANHYEDIRRGKRWYLTRGKSARNWDLHCDGRSSDYSGQFRSGINVVKAYVNAVARNQKAYSDLLLYDPKFKYQLQKIEERRGREWFRIKWTSNHQSTMTWAAETEAVGPSRWSIRYTFESQEALAEKNHIETARKLLIQNYRIEAEVGELLFQKQQESQNRWVRKYLAEVEIPNINLATGKSYDPDFESVLPGYDVLDPRVNHHLNGVQFKLPEGRVVDAMDYYDGNYMLDRNIANSNRGGSSAITGVFRE